MLKSTDDGRDSSLKESIDLRDKMSRQPSCLLYHYKGLDIFCKNIVKNSFAVPAMTQNSGKNFSCLKG